jgi:hypothetical protein
LKEDLAKKGKEQLVQDERFSKLFQSEEFKIDPLSEDFKRINPSKAS